MGELQNKPVYISERQKGRKVEDNEEANQKRSSGGDSSNNGAQSDRKADHLE